MKIEARNAYPFLLHLEALHKLGLLPHTYAVAEFNKLRRLEKKTSRLCERYCNGEVSSAVVEKEVERLEKMFAHVPGFFVNQDPRGYALKIELEVLPAGMHTDWGNYGIIAPEF